jgi:hypothetical protein
VDEIGDVGVNGVEIGLLLIFGAFRVLVDQLVDITLFS